MVKFSLIIIHLFYGFFQALYILYINDKPKKKYIKNWSRRLLNILKIHLEINQDLKKLLSRKHFLIVSNHISWIDIFLINSIFPISFLSKGDVARWPLIGKLTKSADTIYIKRGNKKSLTIASNQIEKKLNEMDSVIFFPEGFATDGSKLLPFKSNFFQTAINCNVSILPLAIQYTSDGKFTSAPSYAGDISLVQSMLSSIRIKNLTAHISVLPVISNKKNRKIIANKTHQRIYKALELFK
ncbi:1-acyl-sn-glycerol-3-phosphate acyltransferase [Methylophilaceae bacterium]|nr:1-acyl-sn-glycerol-3-phosphate acyltransferase [Methylophilaceae bacterium]